MCDDEPAVRAALDRALRLEGYEVDLAVDGEEALAALATRPASAVVLDVLMPGVDGLEVCRRMRSGGDRPRSRCSRRATRFADRVAGLDAGADDYLVKPFALEELLARVRALLRRTGTATPTECCASPTSSLDPATRQVQRGERAIELTRTEFLLLELFILNPRQVLPRSLIFERVWGYDFGPSRTRSRSTSATSGGSRRQGGEPRLIQTVRGFGYALREP